MMRLKFLTILGLFLGACQASNDGQPPATKGVRCFDCDYDYAEGVGLTLRTSGRQEDSSQIQGKSRGFRQCAFIREKDRDYVSDTQCSSGTCFIRKDTNGLVYRGCADPGNLPIRVNVSVNCQPQGPDSSIWWFCRGSLCNSGAFGSGDICWVPGQVPSVQVLPGFTRNATGGSSSGTRKTVAGKLSKETFKQIQARAGFGNLRPVEYGGSGLNSEQTVRYFRNRSATAERGRGNLQGGQKNLPSSVSVSVDSRKPSSNSNSSYVYSSSTFFQGNRPVPNAPSNIPIPAPKSSTDVAHSSEGSSAQKSASWQFPVAPVPASNWPNSWNSNQPQYSPVTQQASSEGSRLPEPQMPIPAYKTWNPELENGRGVNSRSDQQQGIELRPQGVDVDVSASSNGNAGYWNNIYSQSQSSGSQTGGSSSTVERSWVFPAFQPSGASATGQQQQQQQGESAGGIASSGSDTEIQLIFNSGYNPCDGVCADNPSGLYNHPSAPNWFVQCGPGFDGGIACQCCRPHYQQCPRGTFFNSATKVCDEGSNVDFNRIDWQPYADRKPISEENLVSSSTGDQSNYFPVPAEGQNVANNGRVQSWSSQVEVSPQSSKPEPSPSSGKSWVPQGSSVDQSSRQVGDSSVSSSYAQSGSGTAFSGIIPPLIVPGGLGNEQQQQQYQQQSESRDSRISASEADLQFIYGSSYNPCDGVCADNPSGLYNHPNAPNWFVQCGPGFDGGVACQCCRPHYQQCPRGTFFSSATKVCDEGSNLGSNPTVDQQLTDRNQGTWNSDASGSSGRTGYWNYVQQHSQSSGEQNGGVARAGEGRWIRVDTIENPPKSPIPETPSSGRKSWVPDMALAPIENIGLSSAQQPSGDGRWGAFPGGVQNPPQSILPAPQASASSGTVKQQQQQGDISGSDAEIQFIFSSTDNPCDGLCADNPSGLYNHPNAPNWFVQCGPGFDGGVACQCCRPNYHQCPRGTVFSSATKVCEESSNV